MSWIDPRQWKMIIAPVQGNAANRSATKTLEVARQFNVASEARYAPSPGVTWCNIFLWDVTAALGCEIPHYWQGKELSANATCDWLDKEGPAKGWALVSPLQAEMKADDGIPVVTVWKNSSGGHGHVALVVPSVKPGLYITQAGGKNFDEQPIVKGFGVLVPRFFCHP